MKCLLATLGTTVILAAAARAADWKPAPGPLVTRWAKAVSPEKVHPEYPRPQMVRDGWLNLNGLWDYAILPRQQGQPKQFEGQILVPFPVESALSGVMKAVGSANRLWYRRTFTLPADWSGRRVLLHFGAVDWESTVWVNGVEIGAHRGGYDPFTYEITEALRPDQPQEIVLAVWDPTDDGTQPRGKQVKEPKGIWYTANTGIWQTVWLEPVPALRIAGLRLTPEVDRKLLALDVATAGDAASAVIEAVALESGKEVASARGPVGQRLELTVSRPKLWSPDEPFLYDLEVTLVRDGKPVDKVRSYFGLRKISLGKDEQGITRMMLNDKFVFQMGTLDQGWWPDGLYTAPTDEALRYDIEVLKKLGFNMLRKHVKVEPDRLYYWCDRLGLLVWQDMPSGDRSVRKGQPDIVRTAESAQQYELELQRMIQTHFNHPSIVMWVPFNEGWGQFDTARITALVKKLDPTRLVDDASGWQDRGVGDVNDMHRYPGPEMPEPEPNRAVVLGEFGGLGLPLPGHTWQAQKNWGYRKFESRDELTSAYVELIRNLHPLIGRGLSAAVYTQTSDVEIEVNGILTYDRAEIKPDAARVAAAHARLKLPPPGLKTAAPTSE
jgi:beta-galactosidase/beta-glucuronidase